MAGGPNNRNYLTSGEIPGSSALSVLGASLPVADGVWLGFNPQRALMGGYDGVTGMESIKAINYVKTLDSGTVANTDASPMPLVLTTAASGNTGPQIQASKDGGTTAFAPFKPVAGYWSWVEACFKISDVLASSFALGLATIDTTIFDSSSTLAGVSEFAGFYKADAAASLFGTLLHGGAQTNTASLATLVNDTYVTVGMRMEGVTNAQFYIATGIGTSGRQVVVNQTTVTNIPTGQLALSVAFDATAAAAKTCTLLRLQGYQEKY